MWIQFRLDILFYFLLSAADRAEFKALIEAGPLCVLDQWESPKVCKPLWK